VITQIREKHMARTAESIAEVVKSGLCIGCGLCEAVTHGRVRMMMTPYGGLRPTPADAFEAAEEEQLLAACPGVGVEPCEEPGLKRDLVWGAFSTMRYAWSGNPKIRYRGSTAGVLTALGGQLLASRQARFILHVGPDPERPMRSQWFLSDTLEQVVANAGSRYGPAAPLAGLIAALDRNEAFGIIAKPCDLSAVHRYARTDPRVDQYCVARLAMVCGGQSRLSKSQIVLEEYGIDEDELTLFRYRGYGNPGRARIEVRDGRAFEKTYLELWQDENTWDLETRCKFCPDALGEAADISVADVWPGGSPVGEDAGFSGIIVRSACGEALVASAVAAAKLVLGDAITPRQLDDFQPHQVRKKEALTARFEGLAEAGLPVVDAPNLRLDELGRRIKEATRTREWKGTLKRVREGRIEEELPLAED
jgi:coenzyme F420 hydrogenase subunit beta